MTSKLTLKQHNFLIRRYNRKVKIAKNRRRISCSLFISVRNTLASRRIACKQHRVQLYNKLTKKARTNVIPPAPSPVATPRLRRRMKFGSGIVRALKVKLSATRKRKLPHKARRARRARRHVSRAPLAKSSSTVFIATRAVQRQQPLPSITEKYATMPRVLQANLRLSTGSAHLPRDRVYRAAHTRYARVLRIRGRRARRKLHTTGKTKLPLNRLRLKRKEKRYRTLTQQYTTRPYGPKSGAVQLQLISVRSRFSRRVFTVLPITVSTIALWTPIRKHRAIQAGRRRFNLEHTTNFVPGLYRTGKEVRASAKLKRERLRHTKRKLRNRRTRRARQQPRAKKSLLLLTFARKHGPYVAWGFRQTLPATAGGSGTARSYEPQAVVRPVAKHAHARVPAVHVNFFAPTPALKQLSGDQNLKTLPRHSRLNVKQYFRRARHTRRYRIRVRCKRRAVIRRPRRIRRQKRKLRRLRVTRKLRVTTRRYLPAALRGRAKERNFYLRGTRYRASRFVLRRRTTAATHLRKKIVITRPYGRIRRKWSRVVVGLNVTRRFYRDNRVRAHIAKGARFAYLNKAATIRGVARRRLRRLLVSTRRRLIRRRSIWARHRRARKFLFSTGRAAKKRHHPTTLWRNWRAKVKLFKKRRLTYKRFRKTVRRAMGRAVHALEPAYITRRAPSVNFTVYAAGAGSLPSAQSITSAARFPTRYNTARLSRKRKVSAKRTFRQRLRTLYAGKYSYRRGFKRRTDHRRRARARYSVQHNVAFDNSLFVAPLFVDGNKQTFSLRPSTVGTQALQLRTQQLKRLLVFKHLLRTNQFTKLSQLGVTGALGGHSILGQLEFLSSAALMTEKLKQQLLLKVAADIRLTKGVSSLYTQYAATTRMSSRALLTYKAPEISYRDESFFISDKPKKRPSARALQRRASTARRLRTVLGYTTEHRVQPTVISARYVRSARSRGTCKGKARYGILGTALKRLALPTTRQVGRRRSPRAFLSWKSIPATYIGESHSVQTQRLWMRRHGRWYRRSKVSSRAALRNSFAVSRPWGVTTKFQAQPQIVPSMFATTSPLGRAFAPRRTFRRLTRSVRTLARRRYRAKLAVAAHYTGRKFWVSSPRDAKELRLKLNYRGAASRESPSTVQATKDAHPVPVKITRGAKPQYHKGLKMNAYDQTVYRNLNTYHTRTPAEKEGELGYKDVCIALKSALSSRERTPEINDFQFEGQRIQVTKLLTQLAGAEFPPGAPLKWENLPKNIAAAKLPRKPLPDKQELPSAFIPSGEITRADLRHLYADKTRAEVLKFINTPHAARLTESVAVSLKKVTLTTWTAIEAECDSGFERSPLYIDLLVLRKAFRVYDLELPLVTKKETVAALNKLTKIYKHKK